MGGCFREDEPTYEVGTESSSRQAWCTLYFGHLAFYVSDAGEVDKVERVLKLSARHSVR